MKTEIDFYTKKLFKGVSYREIKEELKEKFEEFEAIQISMSAFKRYKIQQRKWMIWSVFALVISEGLIWLFNLNFLKYSQIGLFIFILFLVFRIYSDTKIL